MWEDHAQLFPLISARFDITIFFPDIVRSMIGARRRQEPAHSSLSSSCTATSHTRWSDSSARSTLNATLRFARRFLFPIVPPAWSPITPPTSPSTLREFCLPRQEPRPAKNILKRLPLGSCSPSLAKFSRTSVGQHVSISTSTTTLPAEVFRHPTMDRLSLVPGIPIRSQRRHPR